MVRKSREDPIIDMRKLENNAIDYRLPNDSSNPGQGGKLGEGPTNLHSSMI